MAKRIYFTVTNDLTYDQRMHRICGSLQSHGYQVTLVGRKLKKSLPLKEGSFRQKRIHCLFSKGKWFYREYNFRLFFFLLFKKMDAICSIDLDTILAGLYISRWKNIPRVYDAHELFTEMKEVISRPAIHQKWLNIERRTVPHFHHGYTVSDGIASVFNERYAVHYSTIRNLPLLKEENKASLSGAPYLLYQGAVNEARGFEWLIPAMKTVNSRLIICGDGNFMNRLRDLIRDHDLADKIELKGLVSPEELSTFAQNARIGIALSEKEGLNQWLALPNKFFDYIHAGLPQVSMAFPEYVKINEQYEVAVLLKELNIDAISTALNKLLADDVLYNKLRANCAIARQTLNWQEEEKKLISFYQSILKN